MSPLPEPKSASACAPVAPLAPVEAPATTPGSAPHRRQPRRRTPPKRIVASASALPDDARLIDLQVVAAAANASIRSVRGWVAAGRLPVTRINRLVRVRVSDWIAFLDRMRAP